MTVLAFGTIVNVILAALGDDLDRASFLAGEAGRSKGFSSLGFLVSSLLLWPLALTWAYLLKDRTSASYLMT